MRHALAILAVALASAAVLSGCETSQYDGVSRFAGAGGSDAHYYGPGRPPRDFGGNGPHS
jgi:hypothetical protein